MALRTFKETGHTAGIFSYLASRIEKKLYGQEFKRLVTPLLSELTPDEHEHLAFVALQGGEYALYEFAFPYFKAAGHTLGLIECGNAMLRLQGFNSEPVIEAFVLSGYRPGLLACVKIALETGRSWVALRAAAAAGETLTRAQLLDCAVRAPNEELAIDAILEVLKLDDVTPRQEEAGE